MPYTADRLYLHSDWGETQASPQERRLTEARMTNNQPAGQVTFGTDTAVVWRRHRPHLNTTGPTVADPNGTPASGEGFNVRVADMNQPGGRRRIAPGTLNSKVRVQTLITDLTNAVWAVGINIYRRRADGTFAWLAWGQSTPTTLEAVQTWTVPITFPEIILEVGETIHIEMWVRGKGTAITGGDANIYANSTDLPADFTELALPAPGIRTRYDRGASDSAQAADVVASSTRFPRAIDDTASAADSPARVLIAARSIADTAAAADTPSRAATFPRATVDSAPAGDVVTRAAAFPRAVADSAPAGDVVTRSGGVFSRAIADSAPAADVVGRVINYGRFVQENIGPAAGPGETVYVYVPAGAVTSVGAEGTRGSTEASAATATGAPDSDTHARATTEAGVSSLATVEAS